MSLTSVLVLIICFQTVLLGVALTCRFSRLVRAIGSIGRDIGIVMGSTMMRMPASMRTEGEAQEHYWHLAYLMPDRSWVWLRFTENDIAEAARRAEANAADRPRLLWSINDVRHLEEAAEVLYARSRKEK